MNNNRMRPPVPNANPNRHRQQNGENVRAHPRPPSRTFFPKPPSYSIAPWDVTQWIDPVREARPPAKP